MHDPVRGQFYGRRGVVFACVPEMVVCKPTQILLGFGLCMGGGRQTLGLRATANRTGSFEEAMGEDSPYSPLGSWFIIFLFLLPNSLTSLKACAPMLE